MKAEQQGTIGGEGALERWEEALLPRGAFGDSQVETREDGLACRRGVTFATAGLETLALAVHLQDVDVMGEAIEQSAGQPLGAKDASKQFRAVHSSELGNLCVSMYARTLWFSNDTHARSAPNLGIDLRLHLSRFLPIRECPGKAKEDKSNLLIV